MFNSLSIGSPMAKLLDKYQRLEYELILLSGYNLEILRDMFARGYTLMPPEPNKSLLAEMAELAEDVPVDLKGA